MKFWSRHKPKSDKEELYRLLEKHFHVIKYKIEIDQLEGAKSAIDDLHEYFNKVYFLFENNHQKFSTLYLQDKKRGNELSPSTTGYFEGNEHFINVFYKIFLQGLLHNELSISKYALTKLYIILQEVVKKENRLEFVNPILMIFQQVILENSHQVEERKKILLKTAVYEWYFWLLSQDDFCLDYEDEFHQSFFNLLKIIVEKEEVDFFEIILRTLVRYVSDLPNEDMSDFFFYPVFGKQDKESDELRNLNVKFNEIYWSFDSVYSKEEYFKKSEELHSFLEAAVPFVNEDLQVKFKERINHISKSLRDKYLSNRFRSLFVYIGAYLIKEGRFGWLNKLFYLTEPMNAGYQYIGSNPFSHNFSQFNYLLLNYKIFDNMLFRLWPWRVAKAPYINQFFLIYIIYCQKRLHSHPHSSYYEGHVHDLKLKEIFDLGNSIDYLRSHFQDNPLGDELFKYFEWEAPEANDIVTIFFDSAKLAIEERKNYLLITTKPSKEIVQNFKSNFINDFNQRLIIINLFKKFGLLNDINNYPEFPSNHRISKNIKKENFIEDWQSYNFYSSDDSHLAFLENNRLFEKIETQCFPIDSSLEEYIEKEKIDLNQWILIGKNLRRSINLLNKADPHAFKYNYAGGQRDIGYLGVYKSELKVFNISSYSNSNPIGLLIKKEGFGSLIQYNPTDQPEDTQFMEIIDGNKIFYKLSFYGENPELFQATLSKLIEEGRENPQQFLKERGLFEFRIESDFEPHQDFKGIKFSFVEIGEEE